MLKSRILKFNKRYNINNDDLEKLAKENARKMQDIKQLSSVNHNSSLGRFDRKLMIADMGSIKIFIGIFIALFIIFTTLIMMFSDVHPILVIVFSLFAVSYILFIMLDMNFKKQKEKLQLAILAFIQPLEMSLSSGMNIESAIEENIVYIENKMLKLKITDIVYRIKNNEKIEVLLSKLAVQFDIAELRLLANAVEINKLKGGSLVEIIREIRKSMYDDVKINNEVKKIKKEEAQSKVMFRYLVWGGFLTVFFRDAVYKLATENSIYLMCLLLATLLYFVGEFIAMNKEKIK